MLNNLGITGLNHLRVISFDMPRNVLDGPYGDTATTSYSYRLNTAFAPRMNVKRDLQALQQPFLLVAGTEDEAFHAREYEPFMSQETASGSYVLLDSLGHIAVTTDERAIDVISDWTQQPTR